MAQSLDRMKERLLARGTDGLAEVQIRYDMALKDFDVIDLHDYVVINDDFEAACAEIQAIRTAEHKRVRRSPDARRLRALATKSLLRLY